MIENEEYTIFTSNDTLSLYEVYIETERQIRQFFKFK
jgi:hypothetical protein